MQSEDGNQARAGGESTQDTAPGMNSQTLRMLEGGGRGLRPEERYPVVEASDSNRIGAPQPICIYIGHLAAREGFDSGVERKGQENRPDSPETMGRQSENESWIGSSEDERSSLARISGKRHPRISGATRKAGGRGKKQAGNPIYPGRGKP